MAKRKQIEAILRKNKPLLAKKFNVRQIGIFGSFARGNESDDSDIDLLVEFSAPVVWET